MFESICIRQKSKSSLGHPFDLGVVAEALVFYGKVRVMASHANLEAILRTFTPEGLIELLESDYLKLAYEAEQLGIQTVNTNTAGERYAPVGFSAPKLQLQNHLPNLLMQITGKAGRGRRLARRIARKVEEVKYDRNITEEALTDLADTQKVAKVVRTFMRTYVPDYSLDDGLIFDVGRDGDQLTVETNIDFRKANAYYHKRTPKSHSTLSPALLLAQVMGVKEDLYFASKYESEIAADDINVLLMKASLEEAFERLTTGEHQALLFQDFVFEDSRAVAEAIRSGERSFEDVLNILPKAKQFQEWLLSQPPDRDIVKAYFQEVTRKTWIDKLPAKSTRWIVITAAGIGVDALGAGGIGTVAGVALGAIDTFVLDKILKGWKPNQFVDNSLSRLVLHNPDIG